MIVYSKLLWWTALYICMDSRVDDWLYSARRRRRRKVWLISAGRSRMIESSMYVCRLKVASFTYILSSRGKKDRKVRSQIAHWKLPIRTHFRTHSFKPFTHALPHAHRTCGSAIIRTCAPQPNICLKVMRLNPGYIPSKIFYHLW